jgi:hypothetical protein
VWGSILLFDIQFYCFRRLPFFLVYQIGIDLSSGDVFMSEHFTNYLYHFRFCAGSLIVWKNSQSFAAAKFDG